MRAPRVKNWSKLPQGELDRRYKARKRGEFVPPVPNHKIVAPELRFWSKVNKGVDQNGCWIWTAAVRSSGYGQFNTGYRNVAAHRFAYELKHGSVPKGFELHHKCRNKRCVNLDHLEVVSRRNHEDSAPSVQRSKTHCKRGHPYDGQNTRWTSQGHRQCRECTRINQLKYWREGKTWRQKQQRA